VLELKGVREHSLLGLVVLVFWVCFELESRASPSPLGFFVCGVVWGSLWVLVGRVFLG